MARVSRPGLAIGALVFTIWSLISRRGERRRRRFRLAFSSAVLLVASVLASVAMFHFVLIPGTMQLIRPDFYVRYKWCSEVLSAAVVILLYASAIFLIRAIHRMPGTRQRALWMSLGCLLLTLPVCVSNYLLIYRVQTREFERYVMIESRDWQTHIGDPSPDISVEMLDGSNRRLSEFRGKVVLLNFFATWCGPCHAELPHLQELWQSLKADDRIVVLVVSREETKETVAAFVTSQGFTFQSSSRPWDSPTRPFITTSWQLCGARSDRELSSAPAEGLGRQLDSPSK